MFDQKKELRFFSCSQPKAKISFFHFFSISPFLLCIKEWKKDKFALRAKITARISHLEVEGKGEG